MAQSFFSYDFLTEMIILWISWVSWTMLLKLISSVSFDFLRCACYEMQNCMPGSRWGSSCWRQAAVFRVPRWAAAGLSREVWQLPLPRRPQFPPPLSIKHVKLSTSWRLTCHVSWALFLWDGRMVQFSSVAQSYPTLWTPWTAARQASPSITNSRSPPKLMSVESVMPSSHLILCHPLPPTFNLPQHQGLFQWVSSLHLI